jgi:hypothetical protein
MSGILVGNLVQDTTTTTGTGAITLTNSVPVGAQSGSTTFAAAFAAAGSYPVPNIFYAIVDSSGNIEIGLGTLTSATNLTRDFVMFAGTLVGSVFTQTPTGTHQNFAAGTKAVYSNPTVLANSVAAWQRAPNAQGTNPAGEAFSEDIMSGTFTGVLTDGVGTTNLTIRYVVNSAGIVTFQIPAGTVNNTGTSLSITGIPSYLSNVLATAVPCLVVGTAAGGVTVPGIATLTPGATPTSTGSIVFQQYTAGAFPAVFTAVFTASVARGVITESIPFPLI